MVIFMPQLGFEFHYEHFSFTLFHLFALKYRIRNVDRCVFNRKPFYFSKMFRYKRKKDIFMIDNREMD